MATRVIRYRGIVVVFAIFCLFFCGIFSFFFLLFVCEVCVCDYEYVFNCMVVVGSILVREVIVFKLCNFFSVK